MKKSKSNAVGKKFGRLSVVSSFTKNGRTFCKCECDCGQEKVVRKDQLVSGGTNSCGCLKSEVFNELITTHGESHTRLYGIYKNMKRRCYTPSNTHFNRYGGRGIKICDDWLNSYGSFKEWALANGYTDELTIDRMDNDGDYAPNNCRWVTRKQQSRNTSSSHLIEYKGQTKTLVEWCEELDYPYNSTRLLILKGDKTIEEIFSRKRRGKGFSGTR